MVREQKKYTDKSRQNNDGLVYYGVRGAHALQPDIVRNPERKKQTRVSVKKKHASDAKSKIRAVGLVIVGMIMLCMLVQRYATIAMNNLEIQNTQKAIEEVNRESAYLDIELAKLEDIATIGQIAKDELNMDYPESDQIQYVEYPAVDEKTDDADEKQTENNLFDRICDWIFDLGRRISF